MAKNHFSGAKEMGLNRAPIEFWKLVFLLPPIEHIWIYFIALTVSSDSLVEDNCKILQLFHSSDSCPWPADSWATDSCPHWQLSALTVAQDSGLLTLQKRRSKQIKTRRQQEDLKADVPPSKEETKTSKLDRPSSDLQEFHEGFSNIFVGWTLNNANV